MTVKHVIRNAFLENQKPLNNNTIRGHTVIMKLKALLQLLMYVAG